MKYLVIISTLIICLGKTFAQNVSINTSGNTADASAILDVSSNSKGMLVPRMAGFQRAMIISPAEGLLVYDTDSRNFWYYSSGWNEISGGNSNGPASGDLYGNYPSPNVGKIQNLDVVFGVPFDKQVMKWDALANNWAGRNDSLFLPYNAVYSSPDKLFSITNTSAMTNTAIYGKRLAGSGITLSTSNGIWGDNADGNGVAGTSNSNAGVAGFSNTGIGVSAISTSGNAMTAFSTTGFGISCTSQTNFGLGSLSNAVDKAGVLATNTNNTGVGYGVIGLIENPIGGAAIYGKNNAVGGHAGLFTTTNATNFEHALKASTIGNGAAGYFTTSGLGVAGYFVSTNASSINPAIFVSNSSNGPGISVSQNPANTTHGIYVDGNGSGMSVYSTTELGQAGVFDIVNATNDKSSLHASTIGKGNAATFIKNNTTGSTSEIHKPAVLIDNNSKGNALKVKSLHSPSLSSGIDVEYGGDAFGIAVAASKLGLIAKSSHVDGVGIVAENYSGGFGIKSMNNGTFKAAVYGHNSHMFGYGFHAVVTGSQATAIRGESNSAGATIEGINAGDSGSGILGRTNAFIGVGVKGETGFDSWGIPGHFISNNPEAHTNTLWVRDLSIGQTFRVQVDNDANDSEAFYLIHHGSGKLASLNNGDDEKFWINNNGNTVTEGTMTVKGNKGIVRSSTTAQLRTEIVSAVFDIVNSQIILSPMESRDVAVTFSSAFSSAPAVSIANITQNGNADKLLVSIVSVNTTGCTLRLVNPMSGDLTVFDSTWKLIVIGAE